MTTPKSNCGLVACSPESAASHSIAPAIYFNVAKCDVVYAGVPAWMVPAEEVDASVVLGMDRETLFELTYRLSAEALVREVLMNALRQGLDVKATIDAFEAKFDRPGGAMPWGH